MDHWFCAPFISPTRGSGSAVVLTRCQLLASGCVSGSSSALPAIVPPSEPAGAGAGRTCLFFTEHPGIRTQSLDWLSSSCSYISRLTLQSPCNQLWWMTRKGDLVSFWGLHFHSFFLLQRLPLECSCNVSREPRHTKVAIRRKMGSPTPLTQEGSQQWQTFMYNEWQASWTALQRGAQLQPAPQLRLQEHTLGHSLLFSTYLAYICWIVGCWVSEAHTERPRGLSEMVRKDLKMRLWFAIKKFFCLYFHFLGLIFFLAQF